MNDKTKSNLIYSFFHENDTLFTVTALFLALLGIVFDINKDLKNDILIYCSLLIFSLIIVLICLIFYSAISTVFKKNASETFIDIIHKGILLVISFILLDVILLLGVYLYSTFQNQFPITEIVVFYAILFIGSLILGYFLDKIKSLRWAIFGCVISSIISIIIFYEIQKNVLDMIQKVIQTATFPLQNFIFIMILTSVLSISTVSTIGFIYVIYKLRRQ